MCEFGVDQRVGRTFEFDVDDAEGLADLHGTDAAAEAVGALEFVEGVAQVGEDGMGGAGGGEGSGDFAEDGVAEEEDSLNGHSLMLA